MIRRLGWALILCASLASAASDAERRAGIAHQWAITGTLHGLPVEAEAVVRDSGQWEMIFRHVPPPGQPSVASLRVAGTWETLGNGDLQFVSPYAQADVVLRPQPDGTVAIIRSNVDWGIREIRQR